MKKFRSLLIISILVFSLVGCGLQRPIANGKTILHLALREGAYSEAVKSGLEEFERRNNVTCIVTEYSEADLRETIADSTKSREEGSVDLCMVDGSWMAEFAAGGVLANLSDYGYSLDSDIIPATTDVCYYNGDVYLAPYYGNVTVLMYNKQILASSGYEPEDIKSLEDVLAICRYAKNTGHEGFLYRGDSYNNLVVDFLPILLSYGGWVVDEDNHPIVEDDNFYYATLFYKDLIATGTTASKNEVIEMLSTGKAAMAIGWPGWYVSADQWTVGFMALSGRANPSSAAYNSNVYGIWTLGVADSSLHKEEAVALLEYLMNPDVQMDSVEAGGVPCRYSVLTNQEVLRFHPEYEEICNALESGQYRPIMMEWNAFSDILGKYLEAIINEELTPQKGLMAAEDELQELMK